MDLGSLRGASLGAGLERARFALSSGFQLSFAVCTALLIVAVVIAIGMRDLVLRSTDIPKDMGH